MKNKTNNFRILTFVALTGIFLPFNSEAQENPLQQAYLALSEPLEGSRSKAFSFRVAGGAGIANPIFQDFGLGLSLEKNFNFGLSIGPEFELYTAKVDPVLQEINSRVQDLGSFNIDSPKYSLRFRASYRLISGLSNLFESNVKPFDVSVFAGAGIRQMKMSGNRPEVFGGTTLAWGLFNNVALETQIELNSTLAQKSPSTIPPSQETLLRIGIIYGFN